ncbi:biotin transport system ATP-binding protein [Microbacterium resistens]|uniref:Biotin transport system ATP-binding protein n=1 Tax=Microbacterium resistens TaxID=156977 RepID=A0ABU1SF79_9MICO|nr:ABC transporter ATP-binding protein [Microbacterium resistens]MDR6868266.1 biotin transport system ATP-binding protein [Microbacterium resistens]
MSPDIRLVGVDVQASGRAVLADVSLHLTARRTAVIGANGSGKSTFARLLNGLTTPTSGTVRVLGMDPHRDRKALRRRVGFVFANPEAQILLPTPAEDLALSVRALPREEGEVRVAETLRRYGLTDHADAPVAELSGGQRQLLALAAVLMTEPELVVADEPTTTLDLRNGRMIGDLLLDGLAAPLVVVTHDLELAVRCDEVVLFDQGRVRAAGDPDTVVAEYRRSCA